MKNDCFTIVLTMIFSMQATAMSSLPQEDPEQELYGAEADASKALETGDKRLLGLALKALSIPGIDTSDYQRAEQECGVRMLAGDDVVTSDDEIRQISEQIDYARRYNQWMREHCLD